MATCESEALKNGDSMLRCTVSMTYTLNFKDLVQKKKKVANISNFLCYFDFEKLIH